MQGPRVVINDDVDHDLHAQSLRDADLTILSPAGRRHKTIDTVQTVYRRPFEAGIDKTATAVSLGTSIIRVIAGFAAAT